MDQRVLVERAGAGDHDAFAVLVRGIIARLDAAARLILRDPELARDAVQDALVHAWRDLPGLRDPDRFDAWIHRITVRSCLEILRRRRSRVIEVQPRVAPQRYVHQMLRQLIGQIAVKARNDARCRKNLRPFRLRHAFPYPARFLRGTTDALALGALRNPAHASISLCRFSSASPRR